MRKRIKGEIVLELESTKNDTFFINFADIKKIEKDLADEHRVRIIQTSFFAPDFVFHIDNRKKLMQDIKKYWKYFLQLKEMEKNEDSKTNSDLINKIKQIIFD